MLLLSSALLTPELGIIFWTTLIFCVLWFVLGKKAWKPIVNALEARENKIATALNEAEETRQAMAALKSDNLKLVSEAKEERAKILKEAKEIKDQIENRELFTNPKLNLRSLSLELNIKEKELSSLINKQGGLNFYQFINGYRIQKFKILLESPKSNHFSLFGLFLLVDFVFFDNIDLNVLGKQILEHRI